MTRLALILAALALVSCRTTAINNAAALQRGYAQQPTYYAPPPAYTPPPAPPRTTNCQPNALTGGFNCFSY